MYALKKNQTSTEEILVNIRDTPLKNDLIECMKDVPDESLITIKPLLHMLIKNTMTIEQLPYDELSDVEKAAIDRAREEYERGDFVRYEDINWN